MRGGTIMRRKTLREQLNPKTPGSLGALLEGNFNNLITALEPYERNRFQPASPIVLSDIYMYGRPNMDAFLRVKRWLDDNKIQEKSHMPTEERHMRDVEVFIDDLMVIYKFSKKHGFERRITPDTFLVNEAEFRTMLTNVLTGEIYKNGTLMTVFVDDENYKKLISTLNVCGDALTMKSTYYADHIIYDKNPEGIFNTLPSEMLDSYKKVLLGAEISKYKIQNSTDTVPRERFKEINTVVQQQLDDMKKKLEDKVWERYPPRSEEQEHSRQPIVTPTSAIYELKRPLLSDV
jgi:hypothetical protein